MSALFGLLLLAAPSSDLVERLQRDLTKVQHTIEVTRALMKRSRGAHFEADMHLRLAELYVEQSRYEFYLVHEQNPGKKEVSAPKAKLLKEKAIETYQRVLSEWPEYQDNDKVTFFMAHEYRELGRLEEMVQRYRELIEKYPRSKLVPDAWLVLGDYYFAKKDMDEARKAYGAILSSKSLTLADTANFKLGWTHLNGEPNYKKALEYFEAAVRSDLTFDHDLPRADQAKLINVKHEAITDLAFTYTEVHKPEHAVEYFRSLSQSRAM
jgi:tetratricopeptide (TPR) repeat protein